MKSFTPSFKDLQRDIERYLKSEGNCEKGEQGQIVYRGYDAALNSMFQKYLEEGTFIPLVEHFREWNWEWGYNDFLLKLTSYLEKTNNWVSLKNLWSGVIAKRKLNYNKTRKFRKSHPDRISEDSLMKTKELLLESLKDLQSHAQNLGQESDINEYIEMMDRVQKNMKA